MNIKKKEWTWLGFIGGLTAYTGVLLTGIALLLPGNEGLIWISLSIAVLGFTALIVDMG